MKKIFLFVIPAFSLHNSGADFIVLNEGKESDYHQLESQHHQKSVDSGEKIGWSVWKRTPRENDNENAAHYVVFNQFSSKKQMENFMKN